MTGKKILAVLLVSLCFLTTAKSLIVPFHDPYAVHVDGNDTLEGNWSLGGYNLTNGGVITGSSFITGGNIGVSADLNLLVLADELLTLNGDIKTDRWDASITNTFLGIGVCSQETLSGATNNTGVGYKVLDDITSGDYNSGFGAGALFSESEGNANSAFGSGALTFNDGSSCVAIGYNAGYNQTTASNLLIIDNRNRGSVANEAAHALIYGTFHADGVASQTLKFNAAVTVNGTISTANTITGGNYIHTGDADTLISFAEDEITISAGGVAFALFQEVFFGQDKVLFNSGKVDLDVEIHGDSVDTIFRTDGATNAVLIKTAKITGLHVAITTKTNTNYTLTVNDDVVLFDTGSTTRTATLAAAAALTGKIYHIKKVDAGAGLVTIDGNGGETIDGDLTPDITTQFESVTIVSDGSNWHIL